MNYSLEGTGSCDTGAWRKSQVSGVGRVQSRGLNVEWSQEFYSI